MITRRSNPLLTTTMMAVILSVTSLAHGQTSTSQRPDLSVFTKLINQAGLTSTLEGTVPVTVFAPTDEAFKAVPAATLDKLAKDPEFLKSVLTYHIVNGVVKSTDITGSTSLPSLNTGKIAAAKSGSFVTVDDALVTQADITTSNGVMHIIDRVLTPPKK